MPTPDTCYESREAFCISCAGCLGHGTCAASSRLGTGQPLTKVTVACNSPPSTHDRTTRGSLSINLLLSRGGQMALAIEFRAGRRPCARQQPGVTACAWGGPWPAAVLFVRRAHDETSITSRTVSLVPIAAQSLYSSFPYRLTYDSVVNANYKALLAQPARPAQAHHLPFLILLSCLFDTFFLLC